MAYTTINKSTLYFNDKFYTGNGGTNAQTGVGFQPDWTWIKNRSGADMHSLYDSVRGVNKVLRTNGTNAESTQTDGLTAFGADGFTVGASGSVNTNSNNFASWNWKANGSSSSNTDGSITSTVSANTTSGFSIVTYTGTGANATVGHGLGSAAKMIFFKGTNNASGNWYVYHSSLGHGTRITLNSNGASASDTEYMNNTAPTSSVFSLGANGTTNPSGGTQIAYCFAEKTGYSKFGTYTGNGADDGAFIYTGFKPKLVIVKEYGATGNWIMKYDFIKNQNDSYLLPNDGAGEASGSVVGFDLLSNGFKLRGTAGDSNGSGANILYMAFGQSLVGSNNVPCTAF